tara:strand:- start:9752 stop:10405 length:654 start_codon:yes stop_codon:yes gene_type:complete
MANFDISDLISTGMSRGVQMAQEDRAARERQQAAAELANYRAEMLAQQAAQLEEQRETRRERETNTKKEYDYRTERNTEMDNRYNKGQVEVNGEMVDLKVAEYYNERGNRVEVDGPGGVPTKVDADTWYRSESNERVANTNAGTKGKPSFSWDKIPIETMGKEELDALRNDLEKEGRYESLDSFNRPVVKTHPWATDIFTRMNIRDTSIAAEKRNRQ